MTIIICVLYSFSCKNSILGPWKIHDKYFGRWELKNKFILSCLNNSPVLIDSY